jgi:2-C-methyl-D-erythritol 4-phosphate cytidylyltransferase
MNFGVVVAAGKSERMGVGIDKAFLNLGTKPVLAFSLQAFEDCPEIEGVILVVRKDRLDAARGLVQVFGCSKVQRIVAGGSCRQESVANGLAELPEGVSLVAVHDGARPCVRAELISETLKCAKRYGSGVAAVKVTDTLKEVQHGFVVSKTVDRLKLWAVQTPQSFKVDLLREAFSKLGAQKKQVTDEAMAVELLGKQVHLVPSSPSNLKVTTPEDMLFAEALLKQ